MSEEIVTFICKECAAFNDNKKGDNVCSVCGKMHSNKDIEAMADLNLQ